MITLVIIEGDQPSERSICPSCNKEIEPTFRIRMQTGKVVGAYYEYIYLLGCPECKNLFYEYVNNPFIKKK